MDRWWALPVQSLLVARDAKRLDSARPHQYLHLEAPTMRLAETRVSPTTQSCCHRGQGLELRGEISCCSLVWSLAKSVVEHAVRVIDVFAFLTHGNLFRIT